MSIYYITPWSISNKLVFEFNLVVVDSAKAAVLLFVI